MLWMMTMLYMTINFQKLKPSIYYLKGVKKIADLETSGRDDT